MAIMQETKVAVIGAGTMGRGIAQVAASAGHRVIVYDLSDVALKKARSFVEQMVERSAEKGKIKPAEAAQILSRLEFSSRLEKLKDCGLFIEAIQEDLSVKAALIQKLNKIVSPNAVIASNTSSLSITELASFSFRPDRFIGLHFFNPAPLMALVEVVPALQTDPEVLKSAVALMKEWHKVPVVAKDSPGFIVNRLARPFYGESLKIVEEAIASPELIDTAMVALGNFKMGPFELMDFIGLDINFTVTKTVYEQFFYDPRYRPSLLQQQMLRAGRLGRKSGAGFYTYSETEKFKRPAIDFDHEHGGHIVERIVSMLINEAAEALYLNIATPQDLETAMRLGVRYPKGLLAWGDHVGVERVLEVLDELHDRYRDDRYRASVLLRDCAHSGKKLLESDLEHSEHVARKVLEK